MKKYEINYGWGVADLYSPVEKEEAISRFFKLADQCFGIRKSITKDPPVIISVQEENIPEPWDEIEGAFEMLVHNKPIPDIIVWDEEGEKIKSEWD